MVSSLRTSKATAVGVVLLLGAGCPAIAQARTTCVYAGAPTNVLTVMVSGANQAVITRSAEQIIVRENDQPPKTCAGDVPTVFNTDTINVLASGSERPYVDLLLANGPLAPGATTENAGASEIEIDIKGLSIGATVVGTRGDDVFAWGASGAYAGLNVNPSDAGDRDVDISISGAGPIAALSVDADAGDDTITGNPVLGEFASVSASGGPGNDVLSAPAGAFVVVLGGGTGDDTITGSKSADSLDGGAGRDRIAGRDGADVISGGSGSDELLGGAGRDNIKARDRARDTVSCGAGRDRVRADRRDRLTGCERASRR